MISAMKRFAAVAAIAAVVLWCSAAEAKSKSNHSSSKSAAKTADPNQAANNSKKPDDKNKKPAGMTEQEIKAAQENIQKEKIEAVQRHEEYMKQLYSLRAVAIKEHATETQNMIDEIVAKEKDRFGDADPNIKKKADDSKAKKKKK